MTLVKAASAHELLKRRLSESIREIGENGRKNKTMNHRAAPNLMYNPTQNEHWANTASHGLMVVPSILANELLVWKSQQIRNTLNNWKDSCSDGDFKESITSYCYGNQSHPTFAEFEFTSRTYGASLISLFLISTLYHWICWTQSQWKVKTGRHKGCAERRPSLNKSFHYCDRTTIYFFIAGSYTPWLMLRKIHPSIVWLQWIVWLGAAGGVTYSYLFFEKYKLLDTVLYIVAGLFPGLAMVLFQAENTVSGMPELAIGGAFYLTGVIFFKCDGILPYAHAIWHLFVACGAFTHYYGIYFHLYSQ
uniref:Monocyte to macrophage differentiation factor n=1 Tax=Phallusia mammillata TaxID=59560 RepID=A0A6F9DLL4_9ASCI|nr:monocyte to macrophage differentiation factor [Phallusia mammillata]